MNFTWGYPDFNPITVGKRRAAEAAAELIEAEEKERRRFADLLHDVLQQMLVSARFQLQAVGGDKPADPVLENVSRILEESIAKSRRLTHDLSPPVMHHGSLYSAIEWLADQYERTFRACSPFRS